MSPATLYRAEGLKPIVAIEDDGTLMATLKSIMLGWEFTPVAKAKVRETEVPAIRVEQGSSGWTCSGVPYKRPVVFTDVVATACNLVARLYKAHTFMDREGLYLHAGGVRIGHGVVLLTGRYRAGKTVLSAACAAAGMQVFSDDMIPLEPDGLTVRAPGLAIRLRLPLPETLAPATRTFIERWRVSKGKRYLYIRPPSKCLAERGAKAPLRGIVTLERDQDSAPGLAHLAPGDALTEMIIRNFARELPASKILDVLDRLVQRIPCLRLSYGRAEDAVTLIREAFISGQLLDDSRRDGAPSADLAAGYPLSSDGMLPGYVVVRRQEGARAHERGDQAFITDSEERVIYNLNPTGAAVWRLLDKPVAFREIVGIFATAFHDRDVELLAADLSRLLCDLEIHGLVSIKAE